MAEYHKYVFNAYERKLEGKFEEMYAAERQGNFDSWHQDDVRPLDRQICLEIIGGYNFAYIVDVGCGKGTMTQFLKKANNRVLGLDISPTALERARARYPDIEFKTADVQAPDWLIDRDEPVDLIVCTEVLSYIKKWPQLLTKLSKITKYLIINLYIPDNPIGFVKSPDDLQNRLSVDFDLIYDIRLNVQQHYIFFGQSRNID